MRQKPPSPTRKLPNKKLIRASLGGFLLKIASTGTNFLSSILIARLLTPSDYGIYSYSMAVILFLAIPTSMGLPNLLVRYISSYHVKSEWALLKGIILASNKIVIIISFFIISIVFTISNYVILFNGQAQQNTFLIAIWLLPLMSLSGIRSACLQGLNNTFLGQLPDTFIKSLLILTGLSYIYFFLSNQKLTPLHLVSIQLAATGVAFIIGWILLYLKTPPELKQYKAGYEYKKWLKSSFPFMLFSGMILLNQKTDLIILGMICDTHAVGIYEVATKGMEIFIYFLISINIAIAPTITRLYESSEIQKLKILVKNCTFIIFAFSLILFLFIYYLGEPVIRILFGINYIESYQPLLILSGGQLLNAFLGTIVGQLLLMTGHEKQTTIAIGIGGIVNIISSIALINYYKEDGAAFAYSISMTSSNIIMAYFAKKKLNINTTIFNFSKLN